MYFLLRTEIRDIFFAQERDKRCIFAQESGGKGREGRRFRPGSASACRDGTNDKCYVLKSYICLN